MVHPCDKPCGNKTESGYCATTACINPQFSNIGTAHYGKGVQKRIVTNADKLRAMSDEDMAKHLCCQWEECKSMNLECDKCLLDWLRQDAQDG